MEKTSKTEKEEITKYFLFCYIQNDWPSRGILIPQNDINPSAEEPLFEYIQLLRDLGPTIYAPYKQEKGNEEKYGKNLGPMTVDYSHLKREISDHEIMILNTLSDCWAHAEYELYDRGFKKPLFEWVPRALWYYGGPSNYSYMKKLFENMKELDGEPVDITETVFLTEVAPNEPKEFSLRFYWNFLESIPDIEELENEMNKMGFKVSFAKTDAFPKNGYGFVYTFDEKLYEKCNDLKEKEQHFRMKKSQANVVFA